MEKSENNINYEVKITFLVKDEDGLYNNLSERQWYLPEIPRMGELIKVDGINHLVQLVVQSVDRSETLEPSIYLEPIPDHHSVEHYFYSKVQDI